MPRQTRRAFLKSAGTTIASVALASEAVGRQAPANRPPNVVFVFADQWRAQATGYAGDPNVKTPRLDRFAREAVNCTNAVSCCPVCSPYRASLMTGQYPHTHGIFMNDLCLSSSATSIAEVFNSAGYDTAYIGKWHLDGHGRTAFIPRQRRQGFNYWHVLECTHDYNNSPYYGDGPEKLTWDGYDATAQTRDAVGYIASRRSNDKPFALFLSWGPPHNPYGTAPDKDTKLYQPEKLVLRPNVPADKEAASRQDLAGYYAHCSALDGCFGEVLDAVDKAGVAEDTIVVFTSDHGDMLGSHGEIRKQRPWDESIRVPFLLRYPCFGTSASLRSAQVPKQRFAARTVTAPVNAPDVMPTLLGLCGLKSSIPPGIIPGGKGSSGVEGTDLSDLLAGKPGAKSESALIACYQPFGEWTRSHGGREYRGLRTERYTYVRDLKGPWLLFDNKTDPYQLTDLCGSADFGELQQSLDEELTRKLKRLGDEFLPGEAYIRKWGYTVDATGTVPILP